MDARLCDLKDSAIGNKRFLDGHVSRVDGIAMDLKRKWQDCFLQSESNFKDNADFSAAKHCRMELLLQKWCAFSVSVLLFLSDFFISRCCIFHFPLFSSLFFPSTLCNDYS